MPLDSTELSQIAAEAQDIAKSVGHPPGTHHLLLATFTVPGPADVLLRDRGCDEDRVLAELRREGFEPDPRHLEVVHGPAGLDLGGDGPEEVGWAIVGEILALSKGRAGGFLRDRRGPIHDRPASAEAPVTAGAD